MKIITTLVVGATAAAVALSGCAPQEEYDDDVQNVSVEEEGLDWEDDTCQYDVEYTDGSEIEREVDVQECVDAGVIEEDGGGHFVLIPGMRHKSKGSTSLAHSGTSTQAKPKQPGLVERAKKATTKAKAKKRRK